tara:strand:+ start:2674 stop:3195 length:522 start_codon:yes stop_codon:yes gene_type:complete
MALSTNTTLSFAEIATEFGGTRPHSLGEYYALAALGVADIPTGATGDKTISFGTFRGKSKNVITRELIPDETTNYTWVTVTATVHYTEASASHSYGGLNHQMRVGSGVGSTEYRHVTTVTFAGSHRYVRYGEGTVDNREGANASYAVRRDNWVGTTTDTSYYENTASVAQITT